MSAIRTTGEQRDRRTRHDGRSSRLSKGVERDVFTVSYRSTEHGTEKRYTLTILGRHIYDWAEQTEFERKIRELRRRRHERDMGFGRMVGKINRDMERRKMIADSEPVRIRRLIFLTGASLVSKMASEEELHEAKYERMEANLKPVEELGDTAYTPENPEC